MGQGCLLSPPGFYYMVGIHQGGRVSQGLLSYFVLRTKQKKKMQYVVFGVVFCHANDNEAEWLERSHSVEPVNVNYDLAQVAILMPYECIMAYNGKSSWTSCGLIYIA